MQIQVTTPYQHFKYTAYISLIATLMKPLINFGRRSIDRGVHATTIQKLNANGAGAACRTKPFSNFSQFNIRIQVSFSMPRTSSS